MPKRMSQSELQRYLTEIGRYPVLTREAQLRHCYRIRAWIHYEGGREAAPPRVQRAGRRSMDVMIKTNLRLVVSVAKRYQGRGLEMSDLIQEGNFGLIRGLELFDPTRGYTVSTYSYWWIRQSITRAILQQARTIRLPVHTYELLTKARRFTNEYISTHGHPPSTEQVAEICKVTPERMLEMLEAFTLTHCVSFDMRANDDGNTIIELLPTESAEPFDWTVTQHESEALEEAIALLTDTEQAVIRGLWFERKSMREVGEALGVSRSRAGQIQQKALRRLQAQLLVSET